jgi:hypothetical protein
MFESLTLSWFCKFEGSCWSAPGKWHKSSTLVSIATRLQAAQYGVRIPVRTRELSVLKRVQTGPEACPAFNSMNTRILPRGKAARARILTIYIHLVSRLRMSGAKPLLHLYSFMPWTRKTLLLHRTIRRNSPVR